MALMLQQELPDTMIHTPPRLSASPRRLAQGEQPLCTRALESWADRLCVKVAIEESLAEWRAGERLDLLAIHRNAQGAPLELERELGTRTRTAALGMRFAPVEQSLLKSGEHLAAASAHAGLDRGGVV